MKRKADLQTLIKSILLNIVIILIAGLLIQPTFLGMTIEDSVMVSLVIGLTVSLAECLLFISRSENKTSE